MPTSGEHTELLSVNTINYFGYKAGVARYAGVNLRPIPSMSIMNISPDTKNSYRQRNENASGESYVSGVTNFELVDLL
jgi:hypothetical protein